jgi:hypothetical protein
MHSAFARACKKYSVIEHIHTQLPNMRTNQLFVSNNNNNNKNKNKNKNKKNRRLSDELCRQQ